MKSQIQKVNITSKSPLILSGDFRTPLKIRGGWGVIFLFVFFLIPHSASADAPLNVYFSVGQNTTDHKTGSPTVTISSGIGTFSVPQTARNMGVGDVITCSGPGSAIYISAKITTSKWRLVTATGSSATACGTNGTVTSIAHVFNSLGAAVNTSGGHSGTYALLGNKDDLTATGANVILNIPLYYDTGPDTTAVIISAYTTSATQYIRIYTPTNTSTEVNQSQRHSGKWDNGKWRMEVTSAVYQINISINYINLDGLQLKQTASSGDGVIVRVNPSTTSLINVSNNIIQTVLSGSATSNGISTVGNANQITKIWNNIVYGFINGTNVMYSIYSNAGMMYVYNNTILNNYYGIYVNNAVATIAVNNIVKGSGDTRAYFGTFVAGTDYNATDGTDAIGVGSNNRTSQTFKFVNASKKDFYLMSTDTGAKGFGANLTNDANLPFSTDIDGQARPKTGPWDIG